MSGSRGRMPAAWSKAVAEDSGEYEWIPLRLPPDVTRVSASIRLSIEAGSMVSVAGSVSANTGKAMFARMEL